MKKYLENTKGHLEENTILVYSTIFHCVVLIKHFVKNPNFFVEKTLKKLKA